MRALIAKEIQKLRKAGLRGMALYAALAGRFWQLGSSFVQAQYYLRRVDKRAKMLFVRGRPLVYNQGQMQIDRHTRIWSGISATQLITAPGGQLHIGEGCYINGATIAASGSVQIGQRCYFGPMALVSDSDGFGWGEADSRTAAIVIEDDAWLATRCTVLKGVRIGRGAVVAVGAVVTEDVPPYCVVAGAPARIVKRLGESPTPITEKHQPTNNEIPQMEKITIWAALKQLWQSPLRGGIGQEGSLLRRTGRLLWSRFYLRRANALGGIVLAKGRPVIENEGYLALADGVGIASDVFRSRLAVKRGAQLIIGEGCQINGAIIAATQHISLGRNCRLAPFCHLMDGDFHDLNDREADGESAPIILEDDVRLGARTVVLKGVRIGQGAVVLPASVVTKDVAPHTVVGGVPARVLE